MTYQAVPYMMRGMRRADILDAVPESWEEEGGLMNDTVLCIWSMVFEDRARGTLDVQGGGCSGINLGEIERPQVCTIHPSHIGCAVPPNPEYQSQRK
jgi:hypothetical protein